MKKKLILVNIFCTMHGSNRRVPFLIIGQYCKYYISLEYRRVAQLIARFSFLLHVLSGFCGISNGL